MSMCALLQSSQIFLSQWAQSDKYAFSEHTLQRSIICPKTFKLLTVCVQCRYLQTVKHKLIWSTSRKAHKAIYDICNIIWKMTKYIFLTGQCSLCVIFKDGKIYTKQYKTVRYYFKTWKLVFAAFFFSIIITNFVSWKWFLSVYNVLWKKI